MAEFSPPATGLNPVNPHAPAEERRLQCPRTMTSRALQRIVQRLVLIGTTAAGLTACGNVDDDPCREVVHKTVVFDQPPDPSLAFQIETCRIDSGACRDLCMTAMARAHLPGELQDCDVTFATARVEVDVGYSILVTRPECPVDIFIDAGPVPFRAPTPWSPSPSSPTQRALTGGSS